MRIIKTFSFDTDNDQDVLDYCKLQENTSSYIRDLIRADMCKKECVSVTDTVTCAINRCFETWHSKTQPAAVLENPCGISQGDYDDLGLTVYLHAIAYIEES